jgi:hypothetical protein
VARTVQHRKSGWSWLFALISVAWAISVPLYAMTYINRSASEILTKCSAYRTQGNYQAAGEEMKLQITGQAECRYNFYQALMSPRKLVGTLLGNGPQLAMTAILWSFILVPIALLWLLRGITIQATPERRRFQ